LIIVHTAPFIRNKTAYFEAAVVAVSLVLYAARLLLRNDGVQTGVFPLLFGGLALFFAWLLFHFVTYLGITTKERRWASLGAALAAISLVFAALRLNDIHTLRDLLADAIGVGIMFGLLELMFESQRYLGKHLAKMAILPPFIFTALTLWAAMTIILPSPLWTGATRNALYYGGTALLTIILQDFFRGQLIPEYKRPGNNNFMIFLLGALAIWLLGGLLIWLPAVAFRISHIGIYAMLLAISLSAALLITAVCEIFFVEQARLRRQVSVTAAELAQLRSQVNPHFLFNALNSLYAAAWKEKSEKTADGIQRLGDMMRFMLQENDREKIELDKELTYLHNYIHIQRIRIDESQGIDIRIKIEAPGRTGGIAPMMLVPFVENAFKHGISQIKPSWVWVNLSFNTSGLYLKVQNSRHQKAEIGPQPAPSGTGLENVKRRLELAYPGKHSLTITPSDKAYMVELTLKLW